MKLTTPEGFIIEGEYEEVMKAYDHLASQFQIQVQVQNEDLNRTIDDLREQRILWGKQSQ